MRPEGGAHTAAPFSTSWRGTKRPILHLARRIDRIRHQVQLQPLIAPFHDSENDNGDYTVGTWRPRSDGITSAGGWEVAPDSTMPGRHDRPGLFGQVLEA